MRPQPPLVMEAAVKALEEISFTLSDEQEITRLRGIITLLTILQREWDTCAANRVVAISAYTGLVRRGSLLVSEDRRATLSPALAAGDAATSDLRISSLETTLDQLRAAIITLQTWLEESEGSEGSEENALLAEIVRAEYEEACREDRNTPLW